MPNTTSKTTATDGPLQLADEPRVERYEVLSELGVVVEVEHNIDTGQSSYTWTDRSELTVPTNGS